MFRKYPTPPPVSVPAPITDTHLHQSHPDTHSTPNVQLSRYYFTFAVEYHLRVHPAVRVVNLVINILFRSLFVPTIHRPGRILSSSLNGMIFLSFDTPLSMMPHCLGTTTAHQSSFTSRFRVHAIIPHDFMDRSSAQMLCVNILH